MKCQIHRKLRSGCTFLMVWGGIFLGISLCGMPDWAVASDRKISLYVDSGRLTVQWNQVTLRTVLGQLHKQLGLEYVAPDVELEKVISVRLQNEPLPRALSKILAHWDYAFTLNAAGNIIRLHVMPKMSPELSLADKMAKGRGLESPEQKNANSLQKYGLVDNGLDSKGENQMNKNVLRSDRRTNAKRGSGGQVDATRNVAMEIRPPLPGTSMPILPASSRDMPITSGGSGRVMEIIPPTAYSPMNIQPVPKYIQQEMLLPLNP